MRNELDTPHVHDEERCRDEHDTGSRITDEHEKLHVRAVSLSHEQRQMQHDAHQELETGEGEDEKCRDADLLLHLLVEAAPVDLPHANQCEHGGRGGKAQFIH